MDTIYAILSTIAGFFIAALICGIIFGDAFGGVITILIFLVAWFFCGVGVNSLIRKWK